MTLQCATYSANSPTPGRRVLCAMVEQGVRCLGRVLRLPMEQFVPRFLEAARKSPCGLPSWPADAASSALVIANACLFPARSGADLARRRSTAELRWGNEDRFVRPQHAIGSGLGRVIASTENEKGGPQGPDETAVFKEIRPACQPDQSKEANTENARSSQTLPIFGHRMG